MKLPELPPLPTPDSTVYGPNRTVLGHAHLSAKVREYARAYGIACTNAAFEEAAYLCAGERRLGIDDERAYYGELMATAIRAIEVET